jgi:polysaccharide pyruvyl transferase WcaK-like protein
MWGYKKPEPAANWLNDGSDFGALSEQLESANLPIIALGLGAQSTLDKKIPRLKPGTKRLLSVLAERSPIISACGPFSCEVLEHYGAKNSVATGCPSLLMSRGTCPAFRVSDAPLMKEDIVIHSTRHHFNTTAPFHTYLYRQAYLNGYDLLLQSERSDLFYATGQVAGDEMMAKANSCLQEVYSAEVSDIEAYLEKHGQVYFDVEEWYDYCRSRRFFLGTRIHGTIAAILSGTPSLLIAHDSRTVELAETMGIPFVLKDEVDVTRPLDLERYYAQALGHDFAPGYSRYWETYRDFFASIGLQTNLYG